MADPDVLSRRLQKLEQLLRGLEGLRSMPKDAFLSDAKEQAVAERWLHLAAECVLDIAHHIIADQRLREPASYRDSIDILVEASVIDPRLGAELAKMAGLRNVLVHLYLNVDPDLVWDVLQGRLDDLRAFAAAVQRLD